MASKRRIRRQAPRCDTKKQHTQEEARLEAARLRRTHASVHHYYCAKHDCWHVGHQPLRNRNATKLRRAGALG